MTQTTAARAGAVRLGDIEVNRLGFGAMRITGDGVWGPPEDRDDAIRVLRRALELEVQLIDTADSYGPDVSDSDELATARGLTEVVSVQNRFNISARSNEDVLDRAPRTAWPSCPGSRSAQACPPRWRRTSRGTAASTPTRSVPRARVRSSDASSCPHRTAAGRES